MVGITAYGGYVPFYRLRASVAAEAFGKKGPASERAVAYYDEDSTTMAVAASLSCLNNADASMVKAVYFASTTPPYREKQCSADVAAAIDSLRDVRLADFTDSLRAASAAMLSAADAAKAGANTLVAIGDCRLGGADGSNETALGDASAAFMFGEKNVLAEMTASHSVGVDFVDNWRSASGNIVQSWDVRYAISLGYEPLVKETVNKLFEKTGLAAGDFSKIILYAHEKRHQGALAAKLGFVPAQIQNCMYNKIGNTGCAAAPLMLISALESARPGDKLLYVAYGEGCDAMVFEATDIITSFKPATPLNEYIDCGSAELPYGK